MLRIPHANPRLRPTPHPHPTTSRPLLGVEGLHGKRGPVIHHAGAPALRALMFGPYTHQIGARIERAGILPRSPINESGPDDAAPENSAPSDQEFKCRVQIRQDGRGNVQEVPLLKCNGISAWRRSLVIAIDQASPLPAPPRPERVYASLDHEFRGASVSSG
jgi:hypothetical protein